MIGLYNKRKPRSELNKQRNKELLEILRDLALIELTGEELRQRVNKAIKINRRLRGISKTRLLIGLAKREHKVFYRFGLSGIKYFFLVPKEKTFSERLYSFILGQVRNP